MTADQAVQLALKHSTEVMNAEAGVLDARSGLYGAYSGVLPRVSGTLSRSGQWTNDEVGNSAFGGVVFPPRTTFEDQSYFTEPALNGSWPVLNLSSLASLSAARNALRSAQHTRQSTRNDVAFNARRQFYEVVRASRLATVSAGALKLARDDERRVRALYDVGSVSKSDLLKAQLRTAQSQLDSLTADQAVVGQRIALANLLGMKESDMAEVDTLLTAQPRSFDEGALVAEAAKNRPDLRAASSELIAARGAVRAARFARLPYVTLDGSAVFNSKSNSHFEQPDIDPLTNVEIAGTRVSNETRRETDQSVGGRVSLTWDLFSGMAIESRNAAARARLVRAEENLRVRQRNLESDVHQALLAYREATERSQVAGSALASATENLKLTQEKYNVGSATILELIDAQVQLQRAQSDVVSAMAATRVAEAQVDRVRGRAE
jgi:outer membrane protein TolC